MTDVKDAQIIMSTTHSPMSKELGMHTQSGKNMMSMSTMDLQGGVRSNSLTPAIDNIEDVAEEEKDLKSGIGLIHSPETITLCGRKTMERKTFLLLLQTIILISCIVSYLVYQLIDFFRPSVNRREYTIVESVANVPFPYIYMEFYTNYVLDDVLWPYSLYNSSSNNRSNSYSSHSKINYSNRSNRSSSYSSGTSNSSNGSYYGDSIDFEYYFNNSEEYYDYVFQCKVVTWYPTDYKLYYRFALISDYVFYDNNQNMSFILHSDNKENGLKNEFQLIYRFDNSEQVHQYLLIPASNVSITASTQDIIYFALFCNDENLTEIGSLIHYKINHKNTLNNFDTIGETFDYMFDTSDYSINGYDIVLNYEWFSYDNTVDSKSKQISDNKYYDYLRVSGQTSYIADGIFTYIMQILPSHRGEKVTYVTQQDQTIWDVLSLTGGMFTLINSMLTLITLYLVWGFNCVLCKKKYQGIAPNSPPSFAERQRFRNYIKKLAKETVEHEMKKQKSHLQ